MVIKSPNTGRVEATNSVDQQEAAGLQQIPLRKLQELLAPAAEIANLTEEELFNITREVRERIWREQYEKAIQPNTSQTIE